MSEIFERRRLIKHRALNRTLNLLEAPTVTEMGSDDEETEEILKGVKKELPRTSYQKYLQKGDFPAQNKEIDCRIKRGRPFVQGIESRNVHLTNFGKVWSVKTSKENLKSIKTESQDSGISSNTSNCDDDELKIVAKRVERNLEKQQAVLVKEQETKKRLENLEKQRAQLEEDQIQLKVLFHSFCKFLLKIGHFQIRAFERDPKLKMGKFHFRFCTSFKFSN